MGKNICFQMGNYSSKIRHKHCQRVFKQHIVFHNKWQNISHYLFCHNRKNIFSLLQPMHYIPSGCLSQDNVLSRPGLFPYFLSHVSTIVQLKMVNCQSKRIKKSFDKVLAQSGEESDLRFISIPILLKEDLIIMTQKI